MNLGWGIRSWKFCWLWREKQGLSLAHSRQNCLTHKLVHLALKVPKKMGNVKTIYITIKVNVFPQCFGLYVMWHHLKLGFLLNPFLEINICYLLAGKSVWWKTVTSVLLPWEAFSRLRSQFFFVWTDPKLANNLLVFIFVLTLSNQFF